MNDDRKKQNEPTYAERFHYWFDNRMAKGSLGLIRVLLIFTVLVILLVGGLILLFGVDDEAGGWIFWDSMTTVINAWMPYSEEGSIGYLILMAVAAMSGVMVTSVLIGIFSSAIEDKINEMKNGNSAVIEKNHVVVLGFVSGEYTLIRQLLNTAVGKTNCLVVADNRPRVELEEEILENVEVPDGVRLVCRNIDIHDPQAIRKLSIQRANSVIVNPADDIGTIKVLLALKSVLGEEDVKVPVYSVVSDSKYLLSESFAKQHNSVQLLANRTLSKLIAHCCTQPGLSNTFMEFLDHEGCGLHRYEAPRDCTFGELVRTMEGGVPIGVLEGETCILNPEDDHRIAEETKVLVFTEEDDDIRLTEDAGAAGSETAAVEEYTPEKVLILGVNDGICTILSNLPECETELRIAGAGEEAQESIRACAEELNGMPDRTQIHVEFQGEEVPSRMEDLEQIVQDAEHVVILSDYEMDEEEADVASILRIMKLREVREKLGLRFNITAELRRERNQVLADDGDGTDLVVALNMISLFLAQLANRPYLEDVFRELLDNEGNELYLKKASVIGLTGEMTVQELRSRAYAAGYIVLGYMNASAGAPEPVFAPALDTRLALEANDQIIVLGTK